MGFFWPSHPLLGVPSQIPVSSMMPTATTGLDPPLSPASPVAGIPVSLQAVNQPLMPIAQALNPYQDPLYPGFPLNEKGERVVLPPYSLCSAGEDLPQGKRFTVTAVQVEWGNTSRKPKCHSIINFLSLVKFIVSC